MVYFKSYKTGHVGLHFSGENFSEILAAVKLSGLTYAKSYQGDSHIWHGKAQEMSSAIQEITEIEDIELPDGFAEQIHIEPETKFVRRMYHPDILRSEPLGEFQKQGIIKGITQNRYMYAWEMGLGKTFAIISVLNHLWLENLVDRLLVIAPTESIYNFRREIVRFNSIGLTKEDIHIASRWNRKPWDDDPKVIIMTYRTFLMLSDDYYFVDKKKKSKKYTTPVLPLEDWGTSRMIILDESHNIKNLQARQTKVLHLHKDFFEFRYLLSGTPDPNGIEGYYSQISFLDPAIIKKNFYAWLRSVANLGNKYSDLAINFYYPQRVEEFVNKIRPWVDRQFTKDNIELPELIVKKIYIGMEPTHREIYQKLVRYTFTIIKEQYGRIIPKLVKEKFPFIQLALDNPCLLKERIDPLRSPGLAKLINQWKFEDHSKIAVTKALVEDYISKGQKVILWSGHPATMDSLAEIFSKLKPIIIHGQNNIPAGMTDVKWRDQELTKFRTSPNHNLLIASYIVLSSAVNIIESTCSIYFDRSWRLDFWLQSQKRIHRFGQTKTVIVNPLILEDSLDEQIDETLEQKSDINKSLFFKESLSQAQWKSIFLGNSLD